MPCSANSRSMRGNAGRYISMDTGPTAVMAPMSRSQPGKRCEDCESGFILVRTRSNASLYSSLPRRSRGNYPTRPWAAARLRQESGVMLQMVRHERRDEIVTVVVAFLHAQAQRRAGLAARRLEQLGLELLAQEFVRGPLIDK